MLLTEFVLTSLVVALLPGTGVLYTVSTGLLQGWRASLSAAFGCTLGIVPHLVASVFGLAAILHTSAVAFQFFKVLGVLYLGYLAWGMWKESGQPPVIESDSATGRKAVHNGHMRIALRAILINILNPKLSIFFLAFLPQFVPADTASPVISMLTLSGIFMLMTFVVFAGYGILAHQIRGYVARSPRVIQHIQKSFAGLFAAMGVKLALMER